VEEYSGRLEVRGNAVRNRTTDDREGNEVLFGIANRFFDGDDDFAGLTGSESYRSFAISDDDGRTKAELASTCGNAGNARDLEEFFFELFFDFAETVPCGERVCCRCAFLSP
jgi:hypothetical protein